MTDLADFILVFFIGSVLLGGALKGLEALERRVRLRWVLLALFGALAVGCHTSPTQAVPNCPAPFVMTREACRAYADSVGAVGVH